MKKILLLFAAMLVAMAATAQTPTATLLHDGDVKCFYGKEALVNAVAEAENGDNITLSSGLFSGTTIDKAITLKGAGMSPDTINGITPTTINSDMTINTSDVNVEGVYIAASLTLNHFNNIKIIKSIVTGNVNCLDGEERVSQFFLESRCCGLMNVSNGNNADLFIENACIHDIYNHFDGYFHDNPSACKSHIDARNSIMGIHMKTDHYSSGYNYLCNTSFTNCFLYKVGGDLNIIEPNNSVFYCVGLGNSIFSLVSSAGNTNATVENFSDFFKTFDGNYNDNETFELTAAAQTTYLGDDGTQVGIYGGSMPFDPKPNNPYITKLNVAEKSTPQGTLSVDIQVQPAQ